MDYGGSDAERFNLYSNRLPSLHVDEPKLQKGMAHYPLPRKVPIAFINSPAYATGGQRQERACQPANMGRIRIDSLRGLVRLSPERSRKSNMTDIQRLNVDSSNEKERRTFTPASEEFETRASRSDFWTTVMKPGNIAQPSILLGIPRSPIQLPQLAGSIVKPKRTKLPIAPALKDAARHKGKCTSNTVTLPGISSSPGSILPRAYSNDIPISTGTPITAHIANEQKENTIIVKSHSCRDCKSRFSTREQLTEHAVLCISKKSDRPFACPHCGATFHKSSNLTKHIALVELKLRPFKCTLCDAKFGQKSNLSSHIRVTHHGERRYVCEEPGCGHRFGQNSGLRSHIRTVHLGARDFVCECSRKFGSRGDLNRHIRSTHQKLMPFRCNMCNKWFSRKSVLQRHRGSVHAKDEVKGS